MKRGELALAGRPSDAVAGVGAMVILSHLSGRPGFFEFHPRFPGSTDCKNFSRALCLPCGAGWRRGVRVHRAQTSFRDRRACRRREDREDSDMRGLTIG